MEIKPFGKLSSQEFLKDSAGLSQNVLAHL